MNFRLHFASPAGTVLLQAENGFASLLASWAKKLMQTDPNPIEALQSLLTLLQHPDLKLEIDSHSIQVLAIAVAQPDVKDTDSHCELTCVSTLEQPDLLDCSAWDPFECALLLKTPLDTTSAQPHWLRIQYKAITATQPPNSAPLPLPPSLFLQLQIGSTPLATVLGNPTIPAYPSTQTFSASDINQVLYDIKAPAGLFLDPLQTLDIGFSYRLLDNDLSHSPEAYITYTIQQPHPLPPFPISFEYPVLSDQLSKTPNWILHDSLPLFLIAYRQNQRLQHLFPSINLTPQTLPLEETDMYPETPTWTLYDNYHYLNWIHNTSDFPTPSQITLRYTPSNYQSVSHRLSLRALQDQTTALLSTEILTHLGNYLRTASALQLAC